MKRTIVIAILLMIGSICFGQQADSTKKKDAITVDMPLLTLKDVQELNRFLQGQFAISENKRYEAILMELNRLIDQADKRRKKK